MIYFDLVMEFYGRLFRLVAKLTARKLTMAEFAGATLDLITERYIKMSSPLVSPLRYEVFCLSVIGETIVNVNDGDRPYRITRVQHLGQYRAHNEFALYGVPIDKEGLGERWWYKVAMTLSCTMSGIICLAIIRHYLERG